MKYTEELVLKALAQVTDPITGRNIVQVGRIGQIQIDESQVRCTLSYPQSLDAQQKSALHFGCMEAMAQALPKADFHVHLETQIRKDEPVRSVLPQVKNVIAVASGKGGVGKSTISVNLALGLQRAGYKVGLIDADLYGPSIPTMLGMVNARPQFKDVYGKAKMLPLETNGLHVISMGFIIEPEQAVVLRGPRLAGVLKQFIQECLWPELDYLVIDLPPGTGDIQLTLVQTLPLTGVVLVTTPQQVAVADAIKAMNMFRLPSVNVPILGIVENMSWFTPAELPDNKYYLFGEGGGQRLAEKSESEVLVQVPLVQGVMQAGEMGRPSVLDTEDPNMQATWKKLIGAVEASVDKRNIQQAPTKIVGIQ